LVYFRLWSRGSGSIMTRGSGSTLDSGLGGLGLL